jgi:tetratricopeptide (TPR) repeat protein
MAEGALNVASTLKTASTDTWSNGQAAAILLACLLGGTAGGWLIRKFTVNQASPQAVSSAAPAAESQSAPPNFGMQSSLPSPQQLKDAAEEQAAPIIEKLKTEPNNAGLLATVGNVYYDAKQYAAAIDYYERSLKAQPADASVRTDLGTAYWYRGDADTAIAEFNKSLTYDPNKADTLFNLGIVKWQGKKDGRGAVAAWQKLLDANPAYPNKDTVLQLIAQVQRN